MKKYFNNPTDLHELRKQYKELLKCYHPDNGGNVADMQNINVEYEKLFKILKDRHEQTTDSKQSKYSKNMYDWENDKALREVLQKIINFDGINITLCGCWIWIDGNTYKHREELKNIGFRWSKNRGKWYWHNGEYIRKGNSNMTFGDIENKYGSTNIKTKSKILLEA